MDNYNQLLAFIWAYEYGNFSAASRAKGLTPSAMSKLIGRLEARLQVRLFVRGTRALKLTEEGHVYLKSARAVVDAMAEADSLAEDMPNQISGQLKIRTMTTFARYQILPWLPAFIAAYPALKVDIETGPLYQDQFDKGLDLAIYGGVLASSSRIARRIGESQWITCASPAYLSRYGIPSHPRDLIEHRCFHFNFESHWNQWVYAEDGQSRVFPVTPVASLSQGDLLRDLAIQGEGIVRLADFHIHRDIKQGKLVPLLTDFQSPIREPLYLIYAKRQHLSPRIRCFIDFMEQQLALHPWHIETTAG